MLDTDAPALFALLDDIWTLKGQVVMGARQKALFFAALSPYGWPEVDGALMAHVRDPKRGQFLPMPGDVVAQINLARELDGRPTVEEAWALVTRANDEANTVVWCAEQCEARGVCLPLLLAGDEIAARMAFKEAYTRLVAEARDQRRPARWMVSEGFDLEQRRRVVTQAVLQGRLAPDDVEPLLLEAPQPAGMDGLLALPAPEDATPKGLAAREKFLADWADIRARTTAQPQDPGPSEEQLRTRALKLTAQALVDQHNAQQGQS